MRHQMISGGGGCALHVVETGARDRPAILFLHGFSQSGNSWVRQLRSDLADEFRLVAMDLRGHGQSDQPADAYTDSALWAADVDAVIRTLDLQQPVLSGWSYGPLVILDYIRQCGEDRIGGIQLVAGITNLGTPDAIEALTPEFLALVPGFISDDATASVASLEDLLQLCFPTELQTEDRYLMLGYSAHVPPSVRRALLSRTLDNDDVLAGIRKPVLITHATDDVVVKPEAVERHKLRLPHAAIDLMDHAGHACFFNDAPRFNRRLRQFAMSL